MIRRNLGEQYSPLYFLAALGAGGVAVTFFLYLMFLVHHPDTPLVTFNHLMPLLLEGSWLVRALVGAAMLAVLAFAVLHGRLLLWNLREYRLFRRTRAFAELRASHAEVSLMAIPLTLGMSINVAFILGALFVPNLWSVVEYLFPVAILIFLAVGAYALKIFIDYVSRIVTSGDFEAAEKNGLAQMLAIFAFAMLAVGLAAPGAMSHNFYINASGIFFSVFFASVAVVLGLVKLVLGFRAMFHAGLAPHASPSLWIVIPILTLLGIAVIRMNFGLHHGFDEPISKPMLFILTSAILSLQVMFGLIGYRVMKGMGYFRDYLHGAERHPGSYSLICPGVAFFVFGMFFIMFGLVQNGLVEKFSLAHFVALAPLAYIQYKTVAAMLRLNRKLLFGPAAQAA
jgi:hypothetical protein